MILRRDNGSDGSSLLKVEYRDSVGESFLLKRASGCLAPWRTCLRTAPMAMLLASVDRMREDQASGS